MSRIGELRSKVATGQFELTGHAKDEMEEDGFTIQDVKSAIYSGRIIARQRHGPGRIKFGVLGKAADGRDMCVVCRLTDSGRLRVITVFEAR